MSLRRNTKEVKFKGIYQLGLPLFLLVDSKRTLRVWVLVYLPFLASHHPDILGFHVGKKAAHFIVLTLYQAQDLYVK